MSLIPQYFQASTQEVAEQALQKGILKYPGVCLIQDGNYLVWVLQDNTLEFIGGYDQITDIQYEEGILYFNSGDKVLYSIDIVLSEDAYERIKDEIINSIDLNEYIRVEDAIQLIDNKIGDIGDKTNVVEYIGDISYNNIKDTPIKNLHGSLTQVVKVSTLLDGVYKITGQYQIGGDRQTIEMSTEGTLFIVEHSTQDNSIFITQLLGNTIRIYTISEDVTTSDKYITENYIKDLDLITADNVKEYVREIVGDTIKETVEETITLVLDEKIDAALDKKLTGIPDQDIISIF